MNEPPKRPVETPKQWINYALGDLGVAEREIQYSQPTCHMIFPLMKWVKRKQKKR